MFAGKAEEKVAPRGLRYGDYNALEDLPVSRARSRSWTLLLGAVILLTSVQLVAVSLPGLASSGIEVRREGRSWATMEDDGNIRINGVSVGRIDRDGTVRRDGRRVGRVEADGDIYREGRHYGKIHDDGTLRVDGRSVGRIATDGDIHRNGRSWGRARPYNVGDRFWIAALLVFFSGDL